MFAGKSVFLQILHHSSMSWEITPLYFFSSNNIYFVQKEPIKVKIFETFECSVKICQIPYANFETTKVNSYPNFVSLFSFMKDNFYVLFSSNNRYFAQKEPIKENIFETFEYPGQNLSNSLCQFWNDKSIPLQILYPSSVSWKITPLYFFSSNNI